MFTDSSQEMGAKVAEEMAIPWRAAEAMHWLLGVADIARSVDVVQHPNYI